MALTRPTVISKPFADSGAKNTIPIPTQVETDPGAASFETGFPPATMIDIAVGGVAPDGADMNGILFSLSEHIRFNNAGGCARFDATLSAEIGGYPVGVVLQDNNGIHSYINVLANNTTNFNTTPSSIGVSWIFYSSAYGITPPGIVACFANTVAPFGWLKANGAAISRTTYSRLFAAIGTTFGAGNGSTTFNLPDLRGEFLRGFDDSRGIDSGRVFGSWQKGTLVTWDDYSGVWSVSNDTTTASPATTQATVGADAYTASDYNATLGLEGVASTASMALPGDAGAAWSGITRPRNVALLTCIKY